MLAIEFNFLMGLMFGIVHLSGDEDDDFDWLISLCVGPIQVLLYNVKVE